MAISYVGGQVGSRANSNSTSEQTYSLTGGSDSTPQAGDLVVITIVVGYTSTSGDTSITTPTGFTTTTELFADGSTFNTDLSVNYKFMGGTPDTTFTLNSGGSASNAQAWSVHVFRGVDTSSPLDVAAVGTTGTGTGRPDPAAITPSTAGAWIYIGTGSSSGTGTTFTYADFTNVLTANGVDSNDATVGSGYYTAWSSGEYNPAASTTGTLGSTNSWAAYTMALRPASTGRTITSTKTLANATNSGEVDVALAVTSTKTLANATNSGEVDVALVATSTRTLANATNIGEVDVALVAASTVTLDNATNDGEMLVTNGPVIQSTVTLANATNSGEVDVALTATSSKTLADATNTGAIEVSGAPPTPAPAVQDTGAGSGAAQGYQRKKFRIPEDAIKELTLADMFGVNPIKAPSQPDLTSQVVRTPIASPLTQAMLASMATMPVIESPKLAPPAIVMPEEDDEDDVIAYVVSLLF